MKVSPEDYEKIIEILYRNPFLFYKDIASHFDHYSKNDITQLFNEIRSDYINDEVIETFLANNSTPQDTILLINGALKSLFKDSLDQSNQLGLLFEEIAQFYENEEKIAGPISDPSYSTLYKYISALMLDKRLPVLSAKESGIVLTLISEILNFSNEMFNNKPEFTDGFCENIQIKMGQILLKSVLTDDEWNEKNEEAFIKAFSIPVVDEEELKKDADGVRKKVQKQVALLSLNPFKVSQDEVQQFKEVVDKMLKEDDERDIVKIFDAIGVDASHGPLIAKANDGDTVIIHQRTMDAKLNTKVGSLKLSEKIVAEEEQICNRYSSHDIIDIRKLKNSIGSESTSPKRRKMSD